MRYLLSKIVEYILKLGNKKNMTKPEKHLKKTKELASKLSYLEVYKWLMTIGYFPENYVLPPVFHVSKHPDFGKRYYKYTKEKYNPKISQHLEIHFPKSELTDRTFAIIEPQLHNDIAFEISDNWLQICKLLFNPKNVIYSYSFPIPVNAKNIGKTGKLRAGRLIYEFLEMAENDLVEEAFKFKFMVKTDIKNFYPSIYTHSIAWAMHSKKKIREKDNRNNFDLLGNRLDKLFQAANDGCTNGIAIGPAVSDIIAELILAQSDLYISENINKEDYLCVRFKDDYRILCKDIKSANKIIKIIQASLKKYNLQMNENKTEILELPNGLTREWSKEYNKLDLRENKNDFKYFKDFYFNILDIDRKYPETGVIDRFLSKLRTNNYEPLFPYHTMNIKKSTSLLFLLAERRIKSFPTILGLIEIGIKTITNKDYEEVIEQYLNDLLSKYCINEVENRYLIMWILYFMRSNKMKIRKTYSFKDPIINTVAKNNKGYLFKHGDFNLFRGIMKSQKCISLIEHIDVFKQQ